LLGGRADGVATGGGTGERLRGADGPSRGAADLGAAPGRHPARHLHRVLPPGPRPALLEPDRQPPRPQGRALSDPGGPRLGGGTGPRRRRAVSRVRPNRATREAGVTELRTDEPLRPLLEALLSRLYAASSVPAPDQGHSNVEAIVQAAGDS